MKEHLMKRGHPYHIINHTLSRLYSPSNNKKCEKENITFVHTHNPNVKFNKRKISTIMNDVKDPNLKKIFDNKNVLSTTRQPPSLRSLFTKSKFELHKQDEQKQNIENGIFSCGDERCFLHKLNYVPQCNSFDFISKGKLQTWEIRRTFTCNSKNVIYMMTCRGCNKLYIGETGNFRKRMNNAKTDIKYYADATVPYAKHIHYCSKLIEPYFHAYPIMYQKEPTERKFKEWRLIKQFKPPLNEKN